MKILHIITRMIVGGAQENTLLTCEGLHRRGHEVILLTGPNEGREGSLMKRAEEFGYRVIVTPHLVRNPHPVHDWKAYREIRKLCDELRPDVVHTHSSKAGILGRGAAWKVQNGSDKKLPKVIHTIHGLPFHPYQSKAEHALWVGLERWAAKRCDAIICVANAMTKQALAQGIGTPGLYTTIYSGMDVGPFVKPTTTKESVRMRFGIPSAAYVYATVARLQPLKGHDDLLKTAGELFSQVPDAHLMWIGDGVYRPRFEETLRANGWEKRVTLTGLVPPAEVPELLPAADVLVHPSYREGLARALPQGLLCGKPVISYDCDGAGEVCLDGKTGFIVKTGDAVGLVQAMVKMASDRAGAAAMGAVGQAMCMERFPAEVMVKRIEEVCNKVMAS